MLLTPALAHSAVTWDQAALGNVFTTTDTVKIPLRSSGPDLVWIVRDFAGVIVKQGSAKTSNGAVTLQPSPGRPGYFELEVTEKSSGATISTATTSFAVLAPFDPAIVKNSPFGVQTHFAQHNSPEIIPLLAKAGIAHFRDEHFWASVEKTKGNYAIPAQFTEFMRLAKQNNLTPMILTGWANPLYDYSGGVYTLPHTVDGRQAYANFARALLRNYGAQLSSLEIWNEVNAGTFVTGPAATNKPYYYAELLKTVYQTTKVERPDVKILAGAGVPVPHGFFRDLFEQGAMPYLDVITVHPYRVTPEGVQDDIAQLRTLIKQYNNGKEKPIWATEFSMNVTLATQQTDAAVYLAQIVTLLLSEKVERIYYYLSMDDNVFTERGLLASASGDPHGRFTPKPTYVAYANLIRQLYNTTFHSRMSGTAASTYVMRFLQGATPVHAMWSAQRTKLTLKTTARLTCTDLMGKVTTLTPVDGAVTLELTPEIRYVRGNISSVSDAGNILLGDALAGFSSTQGKNNWSYGTVAVGTGTYDASKFTPMTWKVWGGDNYRWVGSSQNNFINVDQTHPTSAWTVRRWTSTHDGKIALTGEASRGSKLGDGSEIRIYVDNVLVHRSAVAPGATVDYELLNVAVKTGSKVDFVTTPGSKNESSYDATRYTASIIKL